MRFLKNQVIEMIGAAYVIYYLMGTIKRRIVRVVFKGTKTIS